MPVTPDYERFHKHPFIQTIKDTQKWTISTKDKMPIDFYRLIYQGSIEGAVFRDSVSLTDLETLHRYIPNAANYAFFLDARLDNFVVLDIEPKCPAKIRKKLMNMNFLYAETSMSGKGVHLVFPLPQVIYNYPDAETKPAFKEQHGYYEILLSHFVTFTGNLLPDQPSDKESFEELFESMAKVQKPVIRSDINIDTLDMLPDYPQSEAILEKLLSYVPECPKTLEEFDYDNNRYEFSVVVWAYKMLNRILKMPSIQRAGELNLTDTEKAYFLYHAAKEIIPERAKHYEYRDGLPWLWYLTREVMAKTDLDGTKSKKE